MSGVTRGLASAVLLVGLLCGPLLTPAGAQSPDLAEQPMIGEQAPAFALERVGGGSLSLEELRGQFVVIHFGASW